MSVSFVLVLGDGPTLRTLHPAGLGPARAAAIAAVIADLLASEAPRAPSPSRREVATVQGFTGDACPSCQGFAMVRAGICLTCRDCGATTGCS